MVAEVLGRIVTLIYACSMVVFIILGEIFSKSKTKKYKNDEKWKLVKTKANTIVLKYYSAISLGVTLLYSINIFVPKHYLPTLSFENFVTVALYVALLRYAVEYLALRHFDRVS